MQALNGRTPAAGQHLQVSMFDRADVRIWHVFVAAISDWMEAHALGCCLPQIKRPASCKAAGPEEKADAVWRALEVEGGEEVQARRKLMWIIMPCNCAVCACQRAKFA